MTSNKMDLQKENNINSVTKQSTDVLKVLLDKFKLSDSQLMDIIQKISSAFDRGLHGDPDVFLYSPIKMLPTYLSVVPDGSEVGRFFAIDLGGTNFRFFEIDVVDGSLKPTSMHFEIPEKLMSGNATDLFDFISKCIEEGMKKVGMEDKRIEYLGFTFSFPCNQLALNSGLLIRWTKGFCTEGVEGEDVVLLLRKACVKRGLKIDDFVLINDTTGTLLCGAFEDKYACVGVINGTGTNACYVEDLQKVKKWKGSHKHNQVIINTEWGAFGEQGELKEYLTKYDEMVDKESINPKRQIFEKTMSGMYLGQIVRLILLDASEAGIIFSGKVPPQMEEKMSFPTSMISDSYDKQLFIENFGKKFSYKLTDQEYEIIAEICDAVTIRSAWLAAAGLTAILRRMGTRRSTIAADGSMFRRHPRYVNYVDKKIRELIPESNFNIILVDDGSGKGAALAACVASSDRHQSTDTNE